VAETQGEGSVYEARGVFRAAIMVKGKRRYFTLKATNKRDALAERRELLNKRDDGMLPKGHAYTVAQWTRHWAKTAKLSPGTRANYEHNIERYIVPELGGIRLRDLEVEDLEVMYQRMTDGTLSKIRIVDGKKVTLPLSPNTIINVHSNIRRALNVAMTRGHVGRNVAALVEPPEVKATPAKSLSVADAKAILRIAADDRHKARWHLGLRFGLRPAEVLGLTWEHIEWGSNTILIRQQLQRVRGGGMQIIDSAKTAAGGRNIVVPDEIIDMLRDERDKQNAERIMAGDSYTNWEFQGKFVPLVFTQRTGMPIDIKVDTRAWLKLLDATGLPPERRYVQRHTAATIMLSKEEGLGLDVTVVSATLGHAKTSFTMDTYIHPLENEKKSAAKKNAEFWA
jgi:integrase